MRKFQASSKLIYESRSGIKVLENKRYRWVSFDENITQTLIKTHHPEHIILPYIKPFISFAKDSPGPTLLLGLGGGNCVHSLLQAPLHVVEASHEMIAIARKYFKIPNYEQLRITCAKAEDFIHHNQLKYKHLLIDLSDEYGYPHACLERVFFQKCLESLEQDGDICMNFTRFEDAQMVNERLKHDLNLKTLCVGIQSNYLIYFSKQLSKTEMIKHLKQNFTIIAHTWDSYNGEVLRLDYEKRHLLYHSLSDLRDMIIFIRRIIAKLMYI